MSSGGFAAAYEALAPGFARTSGLELVSALQHRRPRLLSIIMTAYASVETAVTALHTGAYDYLVKPFEMDDLQRTINRALEQTVAVSARTESKMPSGKLTE